MNKLVALSMKSKQNGAILVIGLVLLIVVAIAAIAGMEISNLDYKMASNSAFKNQSFQASETGRITAGDAVNQYIYDRSWTNATTHPNLSFEDTEFNPLALNSDVEDVFDTDTLIKDMDFSVVQSIVAEEIASDIYIVRAPTASVALGGGLQQLAGYRGAGKGVATSGSSIYFELRAKGSANGGAQTITASEYRAFIQ